jgi:hypothetical protein
LRDAELSIRGSSANRRRYYSGESGSIDADDDEEGEETHVGTVHPVRLHRVAKPTFQDEDVNAAQAVFMSRRGYERWEIPQSVMDSFSHKEASMQPDDVGEAFVPHKSSVKRGAALLEGGRSLQYKNFVEDKGSASFVTPRGEFSTWEGEALASRPPPNVRSQMEHIRDLGGSTVPITVEHGVGTQLSLGRGQYPVSVTRNVSRRQFTTSPEE